MVLNEGEDVLLDCDYHANTYNLFDYPVLWIKTQRNEDSKINIMGNINEPYVSARRFTVTFTATPPRYKLSLNIKGTCYNGMYICTDTCTCTFTEINVHLHRYMYIYTDTYTFTQIHVESLDTFRSCLIISPRTISIKP